MNHWNIYSCKMQQKIIKLKIFWIINCYYWRIKINVKTKTLRCSIFKFSISTLYSQIFTQPTMGNNVIFFDYFCLNIYINLCMLCLKRFYFLIIEKQYEFSSRYFISQKLQYKKNYACKMIRCKTSVSNAALSHFLCYSLPTADTPILYTSILNETLIACECTPVKQVQRSKDQ